MKHGLMIALTLAGGTIISPAMAATPAAADQATLNRVEPQAKADYAQMEPAAQSKGHAAIHDPAAVDSPLSRRKAVANLLDQYRDGWLWSLGRR